MKFKLHSYGEKRVRKRFAYFPIKVHNEIRWLEDTYVIQKYDDYYCFGFRWRTIRFLKKEEYDELIKGGDALCG